MSSVKDLTLIRTPENNKPGEGILKFSDRYSVFDWGPMPDLIEDKGSSSCITGAYFLEQLEKQGIKSYYIGIYDKAVQRLKSLNSPVTLLQIKVFRVFQPVFFEGEYDYSAYKEAKSNYRIPLEIIYRNSLPAGSSIYKRLQTGKLELGALGLIKMPSAGQILKKPLIEASTKLESFDRYLDWEEAKKIAGLRDKEVDIIIQTTKMINKLITDISERVGLVNNDGKIEYAFDEDRNLVVADVFGTLDESRYAIKENTIGNPVEFPVSKEILRNYYKNTYWWDEIVKICDLNSKNWKEQISILPENVPEPILRHMSYIYRSFCNEVTRNKWYDVVSIQKTIMNFMEEVFFQ
ncbi:phosphoribosylaminoimidazolesuccinocarboxamide synthase [Elusimicrobiota bacterium]